MPPAFLMVAASLLFSLMGVCVKLASARYGAGEIVMYRGLIGMLVMALVARRQGDGLATRVPAMHFWRSLSGVCSLSLWFYSISGLPLATATTLNYMSSIWMAMFLIGGSVLMGAKRIDGRLTAAVLVGFVGVALVLRPTVDSRQAAYGFAGLLSGMLSAMAYLQVTALGRIGEPESRTVFYFSLGSALAGAATTAVTGQGFHGYTPGGAALLLAVGVLAAAAQLALTHAYARGKAMVNACLQYLGIVFAFAWGLLLFHDPVTAWAVGGILLIILAGLAATLLRSGSTPADSQHSLSES
jgi:S-adenosylmethionine uptake transporter